MFVVCIMDFTFLQILVCHFNHKQTADCLLIYVHSIVNFYITILWLTMWRSRQDNFPRPTNGGAKAAFNKRDRGIRKCIESGVKEIDTLASIFKVFKILTYYLVVLEFFVSVWALEEEEKWTYSVRTFETRIKKFIISGCEKVSG